MSINVNESNLYILGKDQLSFPCVVMKDYLQLTDIYLSQIGTEWISGVQYCCQGYGLQSVCRILVFTQLGVNWQTIFTMLYLGNCSMHCCGLFVDMNEVFKDSGLNIVWMQFRIEECAFPWVQTMGLYGELAWDSHQSPFTSFGFVFRIPVDLVLINEQLHVRQHLQAIVVRTGIFCPSKYTLTCFFSIQILNSLLQLPTYINSEMQH